MPVFRNIPLKIFIGLATGMTAVGAASGVFINSYYKTDASKEHETIIRNLDTKMTIDQFQAEQKINFPWIKQGQFKIATFAKTNKSEDYVETTGLLSFDKKQKTFSFESVCDGVLTLISDFDSTITYTTKFSSRFRSSDVETLLKQQFAQFFEDGVVTKDELKSITSVNVITEDVETFNASDFSFLTNLKSVRVNGQGKLLKFTNNSAPNTTKFYVPRGEYNDYISSDTWKVREENIFVNVGSFEQYASVMLFKNGGKIDKGENLFEYECLEIEKGTSISDLPNESNFKYVGRIFKGWKDKDGNDYGKSTIINDDIKLYAKWDDKIYRVKYEVQDGKSETIVRTFKYGNNLTIIKNSEFASTDDKYVFLGWSLTKDALKIDYTENSEVVNFFDDTIEELTLYGVWALKTFDLKIINSASEVVDTIECVYGQNIAIPTMVPGLGEYIGVAREMNSKIVEYEPGEAISITFNPDADHGYLYIPRSSGLTQIVFYSVFMPLNYKIIYQLKNDEVHEQEYSVDGDTSTPLLDKNCDVHFLTNKDFTVEEIEKVGYHFVGWVRDYQGEKTLYSDGSYTSVAGFDNLVTFSNPEDWLLKDGFDGKGDIIIYPYYESDTIEFTFNKGSASSVFSSFSAKYDAASLVEFSGNASYPGKYIDRVTCGIVSPAISLEDDYSITPKEIKTIFGNAYKKGLDSGLYNRPSDIPNHKLSVNLDIRWASYYYSVSFYVNNELAGKQENLLYGDKVTKPTDPSIDGYTFDGWFKESTFKNKFDFDKETITGSIYIYGKITEIPKPEPSGGGGGGNCVSGDTMILMADGSTKMAKDLTLGEKVLTWDLFTGQLVESELFLVEAETGLKYTIDLTFENGVKFRALSTHGFFSTDRREFVEFFPENAEEYIGESFWLIDGPSKLIDVKVGQEYTTCYGLVTASTLTIIGNGVLNCVSQVCYILNIADINENMKYDPVDLENGLALYGEAKYTDFPDFVPENMFHAFNGRYLYVALGRQNITMEGLYDLIALFFELEDNIEIPDIGGQA